MYVFGARVHEYQLGVGIALVGAAVAHVLWVWTAVTALVVGVGLVVKDWPDLFRATRNTAEWRWGVHRPRPAEPRDRRRTAGGGRGDDVPVGRYALAGRSQR